MYIFKDKKILMGIGIGIIIATLTLLCSGTNKKMSHAEIEKAARALGMHYEHECTVLFDQENTHTEKGE